MADHVPADAGTLQVLALLDLLAGSTFGMNPKQR